MMDLADSMQKTMERILIHLEDTECPSCHQIGTMWQWPTIPGRPSRGGPVCISCGKKELKRKEINNASDMTVMARIQKAVGTLEHSSLLTDKTIWKRGFDNYRTPDVETLEAKQKMMKWTEEIALGAKHHIMLTGGTGTGKTHLAVSLLREYLKKLDYTVESYVLKDPDGRPIKDEKGEDKKVKFNYTNLCIFVSYRELLEQLKFAMNDEEARKLITGNLMQDIKNFKVVVIDDIGAELGDYMTNEGRATNFNIDTLTSLTEARIGQATIFTSNLDSKQIKKAYGKRVFSRIVDGMGKRAIVFKDTKDKRYENS